MIDGKMMRHNFKRVAAVVMVPGTRRILGYLDDSDLEIFVKLKGEEYLQGVVREGVLELISKY